MKTENFDGDYVDAVTWYVNFIANGPKELHPIPDEWIPKNDFAPTDILSPIDKDFLKMYEQEMDLSKEVIGEPVVWDKETIKKSFSKMGWTDEMIQANFLDKL